MAESVVRAYAKSEDGTIVVHFDGSFHSDYGLGTVARTAARAPRAKIVVITAVPVPDPLAASASEVAKRADYVIFTRK